MISKALTFITDFLNHYLEQSLGLSEGPVVASSLVNPDGSFPYTTENKIVVSVINLEHETVLKPLSFNKGTQSGFGKVAPPVNLNLYLLISANYSSRNYFESLKMLSAVIGSLHTNPYFTKQEHPEIQDPIAKLTLETYTIPTAELGTIWNGLGARYVPSVIYKMRVMALAEEIIKKEIPGISDSEV